MMTSTGSDLNVFLEGSESERAWSGPDWQVSHSLPHLSKCGESIRMQQKYFLFLKIISIVPLPGWKPRWALGYRWWWGTWNLEVRSNSKVPGQGRARVRQGQTTAIQARGWGPPYIVPSPKLLAPITKPLLSCNQKSGYVIPPPVLILDTKPLP